MSDILMRIKTNLCLGDTPCVKQACLTIEGFFLNSIKQKCHEYKDSDQFEFFQADTYTLGCIGVHCYVQSCSGRGNTENLHSVLWDVINLTSYACKMQNLLYYLVPS